MIKIVLHILERLMKGLTLDFAVTRVFELESKKEFIVNRMMIDNYLTSLKKGLEKNQKEFFDGMHKNPEIKLTPEQEQQMKQDFMAQQRDLRLELPKVAYRQFEVRGYDRMIERILEAPLRSSQNSNNKELEGKLRLIKDQLKEQVKKSEQTAISDGNHTDRDIGQIGNPEERKATDMDKYVSEGESSYEEGESYYDDEDEEEVEESLNKTVKGE